uniref:Tyrosinase_Cu-bd domain-containing protein n=1 Tax=Parastrongyloides trichosuri TaxID=131310 RepID=A0A0N4ZH21_PARTI
MLRKNISLFLLLNFLIFDAFAQIREDCSDAPNEQLRELCLRFRRMDQISREKYEKQADAALWPPQAPGSPTFQRPIPIPPAHRGNVAYDPLECMSLQCLCPFFNGRMVAQDHCILPNGEPLQMAYRKEYRMMTDDERFRYHRALQIIKQNGQYDFLSRIHRDVSSGGGAHSGPGFLPWHREYLKRFEIQLKMIDPTVAIPYWDSTLDNFLPSPRDSIFFSDLFIGQTDWNGFVVTGPFAYWRTLEGGAAIRRNVGAEGNLFNENQINQVLQQTNVEYVLSYVTQTAGCPYPVNYGAIEYSHGAVHRYINGDFGPVPTSANDPVFYAHHAFVDLIFETWRQLRQPRWVRESAYPPDIPSCTNPMHFSYSEMRPFPRLINRDGLSNAYTDQLYRYAPRPTCTRTEPACGSRYLFCDTRGFPHCVSKIKLGGICNGYEGFDACYNGQCIFGRCIPGPTPAPFKPIIVTPPPRPPTPRPQAPRQQASRKQAPKQITGINETLKNITNSIKNSIASRQRTKPVASKNQTIVTFVDCFNRNPCCESWALLGECKDNSKYMNINCPSSCKLCTPSYSLNDTCTDRHVSCKQWKGEDQCSQSTGPHLNFILENCRESCGLCNSKKSDKCTIPKRKRKLAEELNIHSALTKKSSVVNKETNILRKLA